LVELCEYDIDALIGGIHTDEQYRYSVIHPLHTAILCYMVAQDLKMDIDKTICLMAAALTSNVGMFEVQDEMNAQDGPLDTEQKRIVKNHPIVSAKILKRAGIKNKLWLETVLQHHEQIDGSGYPRQLRGTAFLREARILGLADRYHAMISPRAYRKGLSPTQALKKIFQTRGKEIDEKIALLFIKIVGIYPPGSFVRLSNGETAIVTRRGGDPMKPVVKSILSRSGKFLEKPKRRETSNSAYEIAGLCPALNDFDRNLRLLWDYV
jgi:HD-GYP domain-containing protein (c-di-GMP phosphodiesterase class II)